MSTTEVVTVGLSETGNDKLDELKELGFFAEKLDGYRFAVALAVAHGVNPPELIKRSTFLNVGSLDPDQVLRRTIEALMSEEVKDTTVYRLIERLADWGVHELHTQAQSGEIDFAALLSQAEAN